MSDKAKWNDEVYTDLCKLDRNELAAMAREFKNPSVAVRKAMNRKQLAGAIRRRQLLDVVSPEISAVPDKAAPSDVPSEAASETVNPDFEAKLIGAPGAPKERGGKRDGAGRPEGLTDEIARVNAAMSIKYANPALTEIFEAVFGLIALRTGIADLALKEDDHADLAIHTEKLLTLHGKSVNPGMMIRLNAGACFVNIGLDVRRIIQEHKQKHEAPLPPIEVEVNA